VNPADRANSAARCASPLPPPARELPGELDREPVGRLQGKGVVTANRAALSGLLEELHPTLERLGEAFLLGAEHTRDLFSVLSELGVGG
jgi:hypothetical protein